MPRRVNLPHADDIFRPTVVPDRVEESVDLSPTTPTARPQPSGRVKHDEKMTVYVTADELFDLEQARLLLRRDLGVGVDRGRIVRAAVAIALADLADRGSDSDLVARLAEQ